MKTLVGSFLVVLTSLGVVGPRIKDGTNSKAEADRGSQAYFKGDHKEAVSAYGSVKKLSPGVISSFDLGTSLVAAGDRDRGAKELEEAVKDPKLGAVAHYNRGNAELDAKKYDGAIREYIDALRLNPRDLRFKRNLEIALRRKQEQEKKQQSQGGGKQKQEQGGQKQSGENKSGQQPPQQNQQPNPTQRKDQKSNEMESILRSVEQQEREELQRMLKARVAKRPIGW